MIYEKKDTTALITINRPKALNDVQFPDVGRAHRGAGDGGEGYRSPLRDSHGSRGAGIYGRRRYQGGSSAE